MTALRKECPGVPVATLCGLFGKRRQWYYENKKSVLPERSRREVLRFVMDGHRLSCPRMGCTKLYHLVRAELGAEMTGGRDAFLRKARESGYVLPKGKRRKTTDSDHVFKKYPDAVKGVDILHVNQVWAADITYIQIQGDVLYLHLVTDLYSRAIIGWCLSETLEVRHTLDALEMAIAAAGGGNLCGTTHHSDRGSQYASHAYVDLLTRHHIRISMTEGYNPTDNAYAERVNGVLKTEWLYHQTPFASLAEARLCIGRIVRAYNEERPHMSLNWRTPMSVYCWPS